MRRLGRDVEGGGGLVGDQELRAERDRHGDADALALAAGELVRVARRAGSGRRAGRRGRGWRRRWRGASARLARPWTRTVSATWCADRLQRVQRGHRLLEDHADVAAADRGTSRARPRAMRSVPSRRTRPVAVAPCGQQPHHRERGHRLARAALADDAEDLAGGGGHRDVAQDRLAVDRRPTGPRSRGRLTARPRAPRGRGRRRRRRRRWRRSRGSSRRRPRPRRRRGRRRRRARRVPGPIAGRSMRRSWPGFGALKRTPRAPAGRSAGGGAGDEVEQRVGALDRTRGRGRCRRRPPRPGRRRRRRARRRWRRRGRRRRGRRRRGATRPRTPAGGDEVGEDARAAARTVKPSASKMRGDEAQRRVVAGADAAAAAAARGGASSGRRRASRSGGRARPPAKVTAASRRRAGRRRAGRASRSGRGSPGGRRASRARRPSKTTTR